MFFFNFQFNLNLHICTPVLAGRAHTRPAALRLVTLSCGTSQGSTEGWLGSQGGGGLLEVGGAIQGASTLKAPPLASFMKEAN